MAEPLAFCESRRRERRAPLRSATAFLTVAACTIASSVFAAEKTFIDYFQPTPIVGSLTTNTWGAPGILPRDPENGLEDQSLKGLPADPNAPADATSKKWYYWDGQIIKSPTGRYYLFASRWDQSRGHGGWGGSSAVYAVSDNLFGPYVDKGLLWTNVINGVAGRGHNVTALTLPDGRYAVLISETRPGSIYISKSLDGPWKFQGPITFTTNQFSGDTRRLGSNMSLMVRPDGGYEIVQRSGLVLISTNGVMGPYTVQGPSVYPTMIDGQRVRNLEDPVVWFSGGLYHIVVNSWSARKAYHLTSTDGIHDWKLRGLAYDPTTDFVRYTDGTVNHWNKMERPGVYLEDGHVAAFMFAVIDISKEQDKGNEPHGSKIIVVPFDGAALDRDLQNTSHPQPVSASTNADNHPAGAGGFGGPIVLRPDDRQVFPYPPAGFDVKRNGIPHGRLEMVIYDSKTVGTPRRMQVYLPPGYPTEKKYPVLYLLHGIGGDETEWERFVHPDIILDNLIADGQAVPMIVVMPNGRAQKNDRAEGDIFKAAPAFANFEGDLLHDVIPTIQSRYSVLTNRTDRALAGLSMGAGQALNFGLAHLDTFAWIGAFSSAPNTKPPTELAPDPALATEKLKLLWLSAGRHDGLIRINQGVHAYLKENHVPHIWNVDGNAHDTPEWKNNFYWFSQHVFNKKNPPRFAIFNAAHLTGQ